MIILKHIINYHDYLKYNEIIDIKYIYTLSLILLVNHILLLYN